MIPDPVPVFRVIIVNNVFVGSVPPDFDHPSGGDPAGSLNGLEYTLQPWPSNGKQRESD